MESSLSRTFYQISGEVGAFLGYGRGVENGDDAWDSEEDAKIKSFVRSGLSNFYWPPPLSGVSHVWSFLRPSTDLKLLIGATSVDLPADFGGVDGPVVIVADGRLTADLTQMGEGQIRQSAQLQPSITGRPWGFAVVPLRGTTKAAGQRWKLEFFPKADATYTIRLNYQINPDFLSGSYPYAYGGVQHTETILESCLACAESRGDNEVGVHKALFMERLATSISLDRKFEPRNMGRNIDRSDRHRLQLHLHGQGRVTINGVFYDN